jgi:hypothetical protein
MERSENKTKKKRKIAIIFASKRKKAKRKRKTPSFSLRSEMEAIFFRFNAKKVFFSLVFASEAKRK